MRIRDKNDFEEYTIICLGVGGKGAEGGESDGLRGRRGDERGTVKIN